MLRARERAQLLLLLLFSPLDSQLSPSKSLGVHQLPSFFFPFALLQKGQQQLLSSFYFPCFATKRSTIVVIIFFSLFEKK